MLQNSHSRYVRVLRRLLSSLVLLCVVEPVFSCELLAPLAFNKVADGVYVHRGVHEDIHKRNCGNIANIGFVVGNSSVAIIDPGGSPIIGRQLKKAVARVTDLPITHVIITHFHPDHALGGGQMDDAVNVVAHKNYPRAVTQRGQFYLERFADLFAKGDSKVLAKPSVLVDTQATIDLGGRMLQLTAHRTAHTDNDLTLFEVDTGMLWAGDLLFHERTPSLDGSLTGWLEVMRELEALSPQLVVPGHGPVSTWEKIAPAQQRYLKVLLNEVRGIIAANGRLAEAVDSVGVQERKNWALFDDVHKGNVTRAFKDLEWE